VLVGHVNAPMSQINSGIPKNHQANMDVQNPN
jgi:hypothetical protein